MRGKANACKFEVRANRITPTYAGKSVPVSTLRIN